MTAPTQLSVRSAFIRTLSRRHGIGQNAFDTMVSPARLSRVRESAGV
jgi:hypothetical protein